MTEESSLDVFVALVNAQVPLKCPVCKGSIYIEDDLRITKGGVYHHGCWEKAFPKEFQEELEAEVRDAPRFFLTKKVSKEEVDREDRLIRQSDPLARFVRRDFKLTRDKP